jgi:hypothetical protein
MAAQFTLQVSNWVKKADARLDGVVRKIALEMFSRVILRSPVQTGRFPGELAGCDR